MSDLVGNPEDRFSHNEAQINLSKQCTHSTDWTARSSVYTVCHFICMITTIFWMSEFTITYIHQMSPDVRKSTFWFPTRSNTNQAVQLWKMARGLKFRILKVDGLYYLWSENKSADQLRGYREADLRLCFRICKRLVFS